MALVENLSEDVGFSKDIPLFVMDPHFESNNLTTQPHGEPIVSALLSYAETGDAFTAQDLQTAVGLTELSSGDFLRTFQKVSGRWGGFFDHAAKVSQMKRSIRAIAARRPDMEIIAVDDLPTYEGIHFNTDAQIEIGKRLAHAYKKVSTP